MTLTDAKAAILAGVTFGACYPRLADDDDRAALRDWFCRTPEVRPRTVASLNGHAQKTGTAMLAASRRAKEIGYEGDPCGTCGALKLRRNGACLLCDSCGSASGCS